MNNQNEDEETYGLYPSVNPAWLDRLIGTITYFLVIGSIWLFFAWWKASL